VRRVSIRRILVVLGLFFAVGLGLVVLIVGGWLIWGSWVSPMEKRAMRVAPDRIDEVAHCDGSAQNDCDQRFQAAKLAIVVCQKKQVTAYDKQLVPLLNLQLDGARTEYKARVKASTDQRYARMLVVLEDSNRETEALLRSHLQ